MKKSTKFLLFVYLFINFSLYANNISDREDYEIEVVGKLDNTMYSVENDFNSRILNKPHAQYPLSRIATSPPTVTSPIYLCQNSTAVPLTATPSAGGTLNWYGTNTTGGTASSTAPTPSTATVGTTSYYVSETISGVESTRSKIDVIIVADNGTSILNLRCDPTQIAAADKNSSVFFDWSNTIGVPNQYTYSYSVDSGAAVTGTTGPTNLQVFGLLPGQSVTLTVWHTTYPCDRSEFTCFVPCGTSTVTPNFPAITPFCSGTVAPILGTTSPNLITGTWSPAIISNTTNGSYVFTPNPILFPCATTQTLPVTVTPLATPTFTTIPAVVCQNATAPVLPLSSSNATPITGIWNPSTVNTAVLGPVTYTFTPNPGQCVTPGFTRKTITVNPNITPTFTAVPAICSGTPLAALPTTSNNGIIGIWSPSLSNTVTKPYIFTPNPGQCATTATLTITVTPNGIPTFTAVPAICTGTPLAPLPTISNNGYAGTWTPALNNTATTTYTFTPNSDQCASTANLIITVNQLKTPTFVNVPTAVCENDVAQILPASSSDFPSITGIWSPATVNTSVRGTSDYVFTPNPGQCATTKTISITVSPSNTLVTVDWTVSEAFVKNQVVTITATAPGDYLYQLDDGPFQESPVFEYVSLGTHTITVVDKNGCSAPITKTNVLVVNYPKYFTPNNDGSNDTWNIFSLEDQSNFRILIFDRYGKFLKEIRPKSLGWDGMYNGHPMPANDYWFSVEYAEQNIPKIFKSHFSLKR
ncbi:T9SS type B sorting domain-containing protein [Flavobacterium sp. LS2P90]|uniref:T9SS type B sorting domain-containing protein n=1 Tax=Flavobacterium xylosi TaxID=3230415 RepID=A0ABW6HZ94_9FLAO